MKKFLALVVTALMLVATSAEAFVTWDWSYESLGDGGLPNGLISASGQFTTAGDALSFEPVLSITGQRNGHNITGLIPVGLGNDNLITAYFPGVDVYGILFNVDNFGYANILYDNIVINGIGRNLHFESTATADNIISFNMERVNPIPEPETYTMFLLGLGLMGVMVKRRTPSQQ